MRMEREAKQKKEQKEKMKGEKKEESAQVNMIVPEVDIEGGVQLIDYKRFFSFSYGMCGFTMMMLIFTIASTLQLAPSYWISHWAE